MDVSGRRAERRPDLPPRKLGDVAPNSLRGVRVVVDLRPLQNADAAPITALYLGNLLRAFEAEPLEGETFAVLLQAGLPDPTGDLPALPVAARRWLPPTGPLRAAALTIDPFLLRAAEIGAGRGGAVYHVAGADLPLGSRLPVVATLLDLAPWEMPGLFQGSTAARFGQLLRARILRDATVIAGTRTVADEARRLLHVAPNGLHVVPFAAGEWDIATAPTGVVDTGAEPFIAFFARHDARSDVRTLFEAMALLLSRPRPPELDSAAPWPPSLMLVGASPDDRAAIARLAARHGVEDLIRYAPYAGPLGRRQILRRSRAAIVAATADAAGLTAIEALAAGTPVIASAVGALPEVVGGAGVLVEPRGSERLARAVTALWADDDLHGRLAAAAGGSTYATRTWSDVARATREVYAAASRSQ